MSSLSEYQIKEISEKAKRILQGMVGVFVLDVSVESIKPEGERIKIKGSFKGLEGQRRSFAMTFDKFRNVVDAEISA